MTDLFLERTFDPALSPEDVRAGAVRAEDCFNMHRVEWQASLLAADGKHMLCQFAAPDAESARLALRRLLGLADTD